MGFFSRLFGGGDSPTINIPPPPQLPTAEELFQQAMSQAQSSFPQALGAREGALGILSSPESTQEFFGSFGPTSFEEALASQHFQNVMPDIERSIKHNLSLSGVASSPILAEQIARERGRVGVDIGQYLTDIGNARASASLTGRLGVDPTTLTLPFVNTGMQQSAAQAGLQQQYDISNALAQYQQALQKQQQEQGLFGTIGSILGGGIGALASPEGSRLSGGLLGAGIGGSLFGGSQSPMSMQDALSLYQITNPSTPGAANWLQGYGKGTPKGTYNTGTESVFPSIDPMVRLKNYRRTQNF